jgi:quercetin dioxygenase-like cupin family protein
MLIENASFTVTEWGGIDPVEVKGETGTSFWRVFEKGNIRVRMIDYSPTYRADHWCARGHILLVLEGELVIQLKSGSEHYLSAGMSFQASDDEDNPHLAYSEMGARVFIVD